jgi:hypothetical protein
MRPLIAVLVVLGILVVVPGCGEKEVTVGEKMAGKVSDKVGDTISKAPMTRTLSVAWQRLVDEKGGTCDRCGLTEQEVDKAVAALKTSLGALGIEVVLDKRAIDAETCAKDISQSNRIWIGGQTLEELLGAASGMSPCDSCCSMLSDAVECRTVVVDGQTYEAIPADLIVRAGLIAGSRLLASASTASTSPGCGPSGTSSCGTGSACGAGASCGTAEGTTCSIAPITSQCCPTPPKASTGGK